MRGGDREQTGFESMDADLGKMISGLRTIAGAGQKGTPDSITINVNGQDQTALNLRIPKATWKLIQMKAKEQTGSLQHQFDQLKKYMQNEQPGAVPGPSTVAVPEPSTVAVPESSTVAAAPMQLTMTNMADLAQMIAQHMKPSQQRLAIEDASKSDMDEMKKLASKQYKREHKSELHEEAMKQVIKHHIRDINNAVPDIIESAARAYTEENEAEIMKSAVQEWLEEHEDEDDFQEEVRTAYIEAHEAEILQEAAEKYVDQHENDEDFVKKAAIVAVEVENESVFQAAAEMYIEAHKDDPEFSDKTVEAYLDAHPDLSEDEEFMEKVAAKYAERNPRKKRKGR